MSLEQFSYVIDTVANYTDYVLLHVKGEPLMHKDLKEILSICAKATLNVNITTNGTLLDKNIETLTAYPVRQISVSLHSIYVNAGIDYNTYLQNIMSAYRILNEKTNTLISLRLWNLDETNANNDQRQRNEYIIKYIENEFNLDYSIRTVLSEGKGHLLTDRTFLNIDYEFQWPNLHNDYCNSNGYCYGLKNQLAILCDGTVVPCCLDGEGIINLGNIFSESLETIISSTRSQNIINGFNSRKSTEDLCNHCSYKSRF